MVFYQITSIYHCLHIGDNFPIRVNRRGYNATPRYLVGIVAMSAFFVHVR